MSSAPSAFTGRITDPASLHQKPVTTRDRCYSEQKPVKAIQDKIFSKNPNADGSQCRLTAYVAHSLGSKTEEVTSLTPATFVSTLLKWVEAQDDSTDPREPVIREFFSIAISHFKDPNYPGCPTQFLKVFADLFFKHPKAKLSWTLETRSLPAPHQNSRLTEEELEILYPYVESIIRHIENADNTKIIQSLAPLLNALSNKKGPETYTTNIGLRFKALFTTLEDRLTHQWNRPLEPEEHLRNLTELDFFKGHPDFGVDDKLMTWSISLIKHLAYNTLHDADKIIREEAIKVAKHLKDRTKILTHPNPIAIYWQEMRCLTTTALMAPYSLLAKMLPHVLIELFGKDLVEKVEKMPHNPWKEMIRRCVRDHQRLNLVTRKDEDEERLVNLIWEHTKSEIFVHNAHKLIMNALDFLPAADQCNPVKIAPENQLAEMASSLLLQAPKELPHSTSDEIALRIIILSERIAAIPRDLSERRRIELARAIIELINASFCIHRTDLMCHRITQSLQVLWLAFPEVADVSDVLETILREAFWQLPFIQHYSTPNEVERFYQANAKGISSQKLLVDMVRGSCRQENMPFFAPPLGQLGEWSPDSEPPQPLALASQLYPGASPLLYTEADAIAFANKLYEPLDVNTVWRKLNGALHQVHAHHHTSSNLLGGTLFAGRWVGKPLVPLAKRIAQATVIIFLNGDNGKKQFKDCSGVFANLSSPRFFPVVTDDSIKDAKSTLKRLLTDRTIDKGIRLLLDEVSHLGKLRRRYLDEVRQKKSENFNLRTLLSKSSIDRLDKWGLKGKANLSSQISLTEIAMMVRHVFRSDPLMMPIVTSGMLDWKIGNKLLPQLGSLPIHFPALILAVAMSNPSEPITENTLATVDLALQERCEAIYFYLKNPVLFEPFNNLIPLQGEIDDDPGGEAMTPGTDQKLLTPLEDLVAKAAGKPFWETLNLEELVAASRPLLKADPAASLVNTPAWIVGNKEPLKHLQVTSATRSLARIIEKSLTKFFDCLFFMSEGFESDRHSVLCLYFVEALSPTNLSRIGTSYTSSSWFDLFQRADTVQEALKLAEWVLEERLPGHRRFISYMIVELVHHLHHTHEKRSKVYDEYLQMKGWKNAEVAFDGWYYSKSPYPAIPEEQKQLDELLGVLSKAGISDKEEQFQFLFLMWPRRTCRASKMTPEQLSAGTKKVHKALDSFYFAPEADKIIQILYEIQKSMLTGWYDPTTKMTVERYGKRFLTIYNSKGPFLNLLMSLTSARSNLTLNFPEFPDVNFTLPTQTYLDLRRPKAEFITDDGTTVRCGGYFDNGFTGEGIQNVLKTIAKVTGNNPEAFLLISGLLTQSLGNLFHLALIADPAMISYSCTETLSFDVCGTTVRVYHKSPTRIDLYLQATISFSGYSDRLDPSKPSVQRPFPNTRILIELPVAIVTDNLSRTRLEVWPETCSFKMLTQM